MSFLETLTGWLRTDRENLTSFSLGTSKSDKTFDERTIASGRDYFRLVLVHMYLRDKTRFLKSWFPAAHGVVEYTFGDEKVEIPSIADTSSLFEMQAGTGEVVARNFHLTPLLPFNGGSVSILAGLFAMEGEDYLKSTISVMSGFAKLLAVPQLSQALSVAQPLADGLSTIFRAEDGRMHLGYHNRFVGAEDSNDGGIGNYLTQGYIAVIRAPRDDVKQDRFWVRDDTLAFGSDIGSAKDYTEHDHMLLQVEFRQDKDDWDALTEIKDPWEKAIDALSQNNLDLARVHMSACLMAASRSPDLTRNDRRAVVERLKSKFVETRDALSFDLGTPRSVESPGEGRGDDDMGDERDDAPVLDDLSLGALMRDAPRVPLDDTLDAGRLRGFLEEL